LAFAEHEGENRAHVFLRSVHNIAIERGWRDLRNAWGHDFPHFFESGRDVYDENNSVHRYVSHMDAMFFVVNCFTAQISGTLVVAAIDAARVRRSA
jgi:hypothetical protein